MVAPPKTLHELYKIEPLDVTNFKRWSQKPLLCFKQLEIDCFLITDLLDDSKTTTDADNAEPSTLIVSKTPSIPLNDSAKKKFEKGNKLAQLFTEQYVQPIV